MVQVEKQSFETFATLAPRPYYALSLFHDKVLQRWTLHSVHGNPRTVSVTALNSVNIRVREMCQKFAILVAITAEITR